MRILFLPAVKWCVRVIGCLYSKEFSTTKSGRKGYLYAKKRERRGAAKRVGEGVVGGHREGKKERGEREKGKDHSTLDTLSSLSLSVFDGSSSTPLSLSLFFFLPEERMGCEWKAKAPRPLPLLSSEFVRRKRGRRSSGEDFRCLVFCVGEARRASERAKERVLADTYAPAH